MQPQDSKSLLLNALIQGATPAVSTIASDAYKLLKSHIQKKIKHNPDAQDTFNQFQANPDANYLAMGDVLEQAGVTRDQTALSHAQTIIYNINNIEQRLFMIQEVVTNQELMIFGNRGLKSTKDTRSLL